MVQFLWEVGFGNFTPCRIQHAMSAVKVRPGVLALQEVSMLKTDHRGRDLFTCKAKPGRTFSIRAGIGKRYDIKAIDMHERRVNWRVEDKNEEYAFDKHLHSTRSVEVLGIATRRRWIRPWRSRP